jgi:serine protease Do
VSVVEIDDKNPRQRGGELAKAWLGVRTQVLMPAIATAVGLEGQAGFRVTEVYPSTKAAAAGLQLGDVLVAIDDAPLKASRPQDERDLRNQVETHVIGEKVEFTVLRGGKKLAIEVELEQSPASAQDASKARSDAFELEVREMTRMDRITRDLPQDFAGVLVSEAASGGWAHIAGIASGQIILRLGGHAIDGPPAFKKAIQDMVGARPRIVPVFLRDGRRTVFRFIEPDWPNPNPPKQGSTEGPRNDKK